MQHVHLLGVVITLKFLLLLLENFADRIRSGNQLYIYRKCFQKRGNLAIQYILQILDSPGKASFGRQLLFSYREFFLYTGGMPANFVIERKELIYLFT